MADLFRVDLFCEDSGHVSFVAPLVQRLARDAGCQIDLTVRSARGGHGRAMTEFRSYQSSLPRLGRPAPDVILIVIDGNCRGWHRMQQRIMRAVNSAVFPTAVVGCPDPHVERWCFADPSAFRNVVGVTSPRDPGKCERGLYKRMLADALEKGGQMVLGDTMEIAPDLVNAMDLYRAGQNSPSLAHLIGSIRALLNRAL